MGGKISFENINECFKRRGMNLSKKVISGYLAEYDFGHDFITQEEFMIMMKSEAPDKRLHNLKKKITLDLHQMSSMEQKHTLAQESELA